MTSAHRLSAAMSPETEDTQGGATASDAVVETEPVSGVGEIETRPDEVSP
jgi:hypothetical protein